MNLDPVALRLEDLRNLYKQKREEVLGRHANWTAETDARLVVFSRCANVLHSSFLFLIIQRHVLTSRAFWYDNFDNVPGDPDLRSHLREAETFISAGLFHFVFSSLETSFRLFARALDPMACGGGAAEFQSIRAWLFVRLGLQHLTDYFELLRLVRNTIHNNGIYVDRRGNNAAVQWAGTTYSFEHTKAVAFVDWAFLISRLEELPGIIAEIVDASPLRDIPYVHDPVVPPRV